MFIFIKKAKPFTYIVKKPPSNPGLQQPLGTDQGTNNLARITGCKNIGRNIFGHYTAGTDHTAVPDRYAGTYNGTAADPNIFTNDNRFSIFQPGTSFLMV